MHYTKSKMRLPFLLTVVFLGFWNPTLVLSEPEIDENETVYPISKAYCRDPSVTAFSAAFYTALVKSNDANVVFETLPTDSSSATYYQIVFRILTDNGLCNADIVAKVEAQATSLLPEFRLADYFEVKGFTVGEYLLQKQVLNCDNAVSLALTYADLAQNILDVLDKSTIDSYFIAVTDALVELTQQLNVPIDPNGGHDLSFFFYDAYSRKAGIQL